jgi:hypothetical protein
MKSALKLGQQFFFWLTITCIACVIISILLSGINSEFSDLATNLCIVGLISSSAYFCFSIAHHLQKIEYTDVEDA